MSNSRLVSSITATQPQESSFKQATTLWRKPSTTRSSRITGPPHHGQRADRCVVLRTDIVSRSLLSAIALSRIDVIRLNSYVDNITLIYDQCQATLSRSVHRTGMICTNHPRHATFIVRGISLTFELKTPKRVLAAELNE